jgi:hypothetical protein
MTRRITHDETFLGGSDITPGTEKFRGKLFKPWFEQDTWGVEIIDGPYKDTVVQVKEIDFVDESDDGNVSLEYHLIYRPAAVTEEDVNSDDFKNLLGLIIEDILKEAMEQHETRNNDTEKSGS